MECHLGPREAPKEQQFYRISSSKPLQTPTERCMKTRANGERELVKYMSKLPGFLERTETPQEKLLNVGVLNWGRLEKWQHSHKHMSEKSSLPSVPQMHSSAALPPDESSVRPGKVQTRSSAYQRTQANSLQVHLMSSPPEEGSQITKSYDECVKECRDGKAMWRNKDHRRFSKSEEQRHEGTAAPGSDRCEKKNLNVKICPESETSSNGLKPEVGLKVEIKSKTHGNRRGENENELNGSNKNGHRGEVGGKQQGESELYHSTKKLARKEAKTCSGRSPIKGAKEVCHVEVDYNTQHSCSLPCEADSCRHAKVKSEIGSRDADRNKVVVKIPQSVPLPEKESASSSRDRITKDKRPASLSVKDSVGEPAQGQDSKLCDATSEKGRNISPFKRLSFSTGKTSKHNSERDYVPVNRLSSMVNSTKSGSQNAAASSGVDNSDCNKPSGKDRAAISPFRRLLEPLLKPKTTHSGNSLEDPRAQRVQRVKLGISGCKTVNVDDSAHGQRLASSIVQALLRVTVKNNQLLFTFSVNKESDILAATPKKLGRSEENECTGIYNFFSIQGHKKNGAWLNQRRRGQPHGIISNVFAQLRVSSSPCGSIREFVLFSVDLGQGNEEKSDLQLKNELAAIVIRIPRRLNSNASRNRVRNRDVHSDWGEHCLEDHIEDRNSPVLCDQDINATVILQSGVHSLPHKGGPSSLIQRWRTGGSCDCGGWDMGCNLRVLSNRTSKNSASSNSRPSSDRLELFFLGGQPEEQPFLSFVPFKEGMYSVGYNSSLSLLQAFSICIAVAESRKLSETLEHKSSYSEHKASAETELVPDRETKPNGTAEARYVAYPPPLSPVGRV